MQPLRYCRYATLCFTSQYSSHVSVCIGALRYTGGTALWARGGGLSWQDKRFVMPSQPVGGVERQACAAAEPPTAAMKTRRRRSPLQHQQVETDQAGRLRQTGRCSAVYGPSPLCSSGPPAHRE